MKKNNRIKIYSFVLMGIVLLLLNNCKKDNKEESIDPILTVPVLSTANVSSITSTTAICGGNVTNDQGKVISTRGVCWSTGQTPTVAGSKTTDGTGAGSFTSTITGLSPNTTYYVRAYATNSDGTGYGSIMIFSTQQPSLSVSDNDGNTYNTVIIGTQTWMAENLKTTKLNNGTSLSLITDNSSWSSESNPAYCWYNNDLSTNKSKYGALYNWYAVNSGNLCPSGWSVPTEAQWSTLITFLGGDSVAGGKLKETGTTYWSSPNAGATNESGFNGRPGGIRGFSNGTYVSENEIGVWWTSTQGDYISNAKQDKVSFDNTIISSYEGNKKNGLYVRCLKN